MNAPMDTSRRASARLWAVAAVLVALGFLALGCSSSSGGGGEQGAVVAPNATEPELPPQRGGRLVFGVAGESDGFLPQVNRFGPSATQIARAVYDPLVAIGTDNKFHPYLAESITATTPEGTEWIIKTRPTNFHNGEKFDADALIVNLQGAMNSALTKLALAPMESVSKVDDITVKVTMNQSWANFPSVFSTQVGYIAAPEQVKAVDGMKPIGTGPFKFQSWSPGSPFKAVRNDQYWQKGLPYLDQVEFRPYADSDSRRKALEAKDIDVAHTNTSEDLIRMVKDGDVPRDTKAILDQGEGDEYTVVLNTQTGLFADKELRVALAKATDKQRIVAGDFEDFYKAADGPYAEDSPFYTPSGAPTFDLAAAKKIVDSWKAAHGGEAPTFRYMNVATQEDSKIAQILQQQWSDAGFVVNLEAQEEAKFSRTLILGEYETFGFKYFNSPDPDSDYYFWSNDNVGEPGTISLNFPRYKSDVQQAALLEGRRTLDPAVRKAAYAKVWQDWGQNVPYIFIFHSKWALIYSTKVHALGKANAPDGAEIPKMMWGTTFLTNTWIEP